MHLQIDALPTEIHGHIFSYVSFDSSSLKACSVVQRSWLPYTQPYFFQELFVGRGYEYEDDIALCHRLLGILTKSPHLALHFRHVELRLPLEEPSNLINEAEALLQLLPRLRQVRSLVLTSPEAAPLFSKLPTRIVFSIKQVLSNPVFDTLEIRNWSFDPGARSFIQLIRYCAGSLRYLGLANVSFDDPTPREASPVVDATLMHQLPLSLLHLEEFRILAASGFTHFQLFAMPNLRKIYWPLHRQSIADDYCPGTFALNGIPGHQHTWTFHIHSADLKDEASRLCRVLPPERLFSLRHLSLSFDCWDSSDFTIHATEYLTTILPSSQIETITASFLVEVGLRLLWQYVQWNKFTTALVALIDATATKAYKVTFVFKIGSWEDPIPPQPQRRDLPPEGIDYYDDDEVDDVMKYGDEFYQAGERIDRVRAMMEARFTNLRLKGVLTISKEYSEEPNIW